MSTALAQKTTHNASYTLRPVSSQSPPDSIQVAFLKGTVSTIDQRIKIKVQKKMPDHSFTFVIPGDQPISAWYMVLYYPNSVIHETQIYYSAPLDKIEILVSRMPNTSETASKISLQFSGKGAIKYTINEALEKIIEETQNLKLNRDISTFGTDRSKGKENSLEFYSSTEFSKYINDLYEDCKSGSKKIQDTLRKYEGQLGDSITQFYSTEKNGPDEIFDRSIEGLIRGCNFDPAIQKIADFYFSKTDSLNIAVINKWFIYGPVYRAMKLQKSMIHLLLKRAGKGYDFKDLYSEIRLTKNTALRDIMLTTFFVDERFSRHVSDFSKRDSCLVDALNLIKTSDLNRILEKELRFTPGYAMTNFSFPDTSGNQVNLHSMKGKVFIMDFYFLGCAGCSALSQQYEREVYPEFIDNPNFKVLSISCDNDRKHWMKAIKSGIYTHSRSINLSTGGFNHPLIKKYGINIFPWVILVDADGTVISYIVQSMSSDILKKLIKKALSNTKSS